MDAPSTADVPAAHLPRRDILILDKHPLIAQKFVHNLVCAVIPSAGDFLVFLVDESNRARVAV